MPSTNPYLWHDRKRFLGMPLSFTRYALSDDRLFLSTGFLSVRDEEVLLYRVRDLSSQRTLWQRMFGLGSITIVSSDKSTPQLVLKNIRHPLLVKELIHEKVEECKIRRRTRIVEGIPDFTAHDDTFDDDDDDDNSPD